ncbi:MAG: membrane-associated phospholipid phosphatase [Cyclobacteriaceae bacterium]
MAYFMRFISGILHPLLLSTYLLLVFYFYQPEFFSPVSDEFIPKLVSSAFLTTFLIPALSIVIMRFTSRVSSLSLSTKEERILPFVSILLFYGTTTYLFATRLGIHAPLLTMMIAMTSLIGLLLLITLRFKISIHAAANWALCGLLAAISINYTGMNMILPLIASTLTAGLVCASRLYLGRHTEQEIYYGSLLGFVTAFASVSLFG